MEIRICVKRSDLRCSFRRLSVRLADEGDAGEIIVFNANGSRLEIVAGRTVEILKASVMSSGRADVPYSVFRGLTRALPFHRRRMLNITLSLGAVKIDQTVYRHPSISVCPHIR